MKDFLKHICMKCGKWTFIRKPVDGFRVCIHCGGELRVD